MNLLHPPRQILTKKKFFYPFCGAYCPALAPQIEQSYIAATQSATAATGSRGSPLPHIWPCLNLAAANTFLRTPKETPCPHSA